MPNQLTPIAHRSIAVVGGLVLALLSGCASSPTADPLTPTAPSPEILGGPETFLLGGLQSYEYKIDSAWPEVAGAAPLTHALRSYVQTTTDAAQQRWAESQDSQRAIGLNITWTLHAASINVLGLSTERSFADNHVPTERRSWWLQREPSRVIPTEELITDVQLLSLAAQNSDTTSPGVVAGKIPSAVANNLHRITFNDAGDLLLGFDGCAVTACPADGATIAIPQRDSTHLLSPLGLQARAASTDPQSKPSTTRTDPEDAEIAAIPAVDVDCEEQKCVALTFDDGPREYTEQLLGILREKRVRASFFMLGRNVAAYPQLARQVATAGHEIGVHSWTHKELTEVSPEELHNEIFATRDLLARTTGTQIRWSRPPYGSTNEAVRAQEAAAGLGEILWSVDTRDWDKERTDDQVRSVAIDTVRPGGVILMHDIHERSVAAVPDIIDGLHEQGYVLVTVSQLIPDGVPGQPYFAQPGKENPSVPDPFQDQPDATDDASDGATADVTADVTADEPNMADPAGTDVTDAHPEPGT